jgi:steroid 5-alpha reductase family enzyme
MIAVGILLNLLIGAGTLTGLWFIYLWKRNPAVVDLGWAIGLTLMGLAHNLFSDTLSIGMLLISLLVLFWGLRLGGYLFWTRLRLGKRDARYESLHRHSNIPAPLYFLIHYLIQACFQAAVGFVFVFTAQSTTFDSIWPKIGFLLWCAGYGGSIAADAQLHRFRTSPDNRGKVCQVGLWNYSRHPNYFFEILLWSGFALIGIPARLGWLGLISPITLLLTMSLITGPISERQSLKSKPDAYRQYQKITSMIIPWFKKTKTTSAISDS